MADRGEQVLEAEALGEQEQVVEVVPDAAQVLGLDAGLERQRLHRTHQPVAVGGLARREEVVEREPDADHDEAARAAPVDRHQEGERADQMRREALEGLLLPQGLAHEPEVHQLQVAEPAVDQLGRLGGGARREVALLEERHRGAAQGQVPRHSRPRHAAADHDGVHGDPLQAHQPAHLFISPGRERGRFDGWASSGLRPSSGRPRNRGPFALRAHRAGLALNVRSAPRPILSRDRERGRRFVGRPAA